ncbi:MAG: cyclase family protein [Alphaproteobacteria bacterium]
MTRRWTRRPEPSTWGDFGENDELGRANLITPEKVRQGVAEVKTGITFCLSLPLEYPGGQVLNPRRVGPSLQPTLGSDGTPRYNFPLSHHDPRYTDVVCDDSFTMSAQYSSQWDSLAHMGAEFDPVGSGKPVICYYNGFRGHADIVGGFAPGAGGTAGAAPGPIGARHLGVHTLAIHGMQGRAVMVDLHAMCGRERRRFGFAALMEAMERNRATVESGDILCLHTGFAEMLLEMGGRPDESRVHAACAVLDGSDKRLHAWIEESGVAAIAADNYAVEGLGDADPQGRGPLLPLHELCLFKLGIPLGELWHLSPLNAWLKKNGRCRFLLTAPPLRLTGAVGSPVTPIATV